MRIVLFISGSIRFMSKIVLLLIFLCQLFAIDIVFVCDNKYAHMLASSLESILSNKSGNDAINVYVISHNLSDAVTKNLRIVSAGRANIEFIKFDIKRLSGYPKTFNIMGYAKCLIPELLHKLKKVLCLDVDTSVLTSLKPLWDTDIGNKYAAAVQNQFYEREIENNNERLYKGRYKNVRKFFNSGVMLMNLERMRAEDITNKFLYEMEYNKHHYGDQPIFNYLFNEEVLYLAPKWNAQSNLFLGEDDSHIIATPAELVEAKTSPAIVHFSGQEYKNKLHFFQGIFLYYMQKTPWKKQAFQIHKECRSLTIVHAIDAVNILQFLKIKLELVIEAIKYLIESRF